jgi:CelD/BcsL family acetyltransferase involved in cellulose biosynthesis
VRIEVIEALPELVKLEDNWNAIYDRDPHARVFLSWKWLSSWLSYISGRWFILAAKAEDRSDAPYVAFFPLRIQAKAVDGRIRNELNMGGNFAADYTGILCHPAVEQQAVPAFARALKGLNWATLNLENVLMSEARFRLLLAHFPRSTFRSREVERVLKATNTNNCICPYVRLPSDWDGYLQMLTPNTRHNIRRLMRRVDESGGAYRLDHATPATAERDIDGLLHLWKTKWAAIKGKTIDNLVRSNRVMLTRSFEAGLLFVPTFWKGEQLVGALATMVDPRRRSMHVYMTGRDESFDGPSPGVVMHAYSIRHAIANGFTEYDFLRGNEPYKYPFGVSEQTIRCMVIDTKTGFNLGNKLDPRTTGEAVEVATGLHRAGKLAEAERGYRQVLDIEPRNADAIHRLGQLMAAKGEHLAAQRLFRKLATIRTDTYKPWQCLAQSCEALGQYRDAANAYREVIRLRPDLPSAFNDVARMLAKLGRLDEVNATLVDALWRATTERRGNGHAATEEMAGRTLQ